MPSDTAAAADPASAESRALIEELVSGFRATAESVVPWFIESMPRMYFQDTDGAARRSDLRAIIAARASGRPLDMTVKSEDGREWTAMRPHDQPGVLAEIVGSLPLDLSLRAARIHTAADGTLVLDRFEFGPQAPFDETDPAQAEKLAATIAFARDHEPEWSEDSIRRFFQGCSADYVRTLTPLRIAKHHELFDLLSGTDSASVTIEPEAEPRHSRVTIAVANARTRTMLERSAKILASYDVNIHRAYLDVIRDGSYGSVTFVGFVLEGPEGGALDADSSLWRRIAADLRRTKWVDFTAFEIAQRNPGLGMSRSELLLALCHLVHQVLSPRNPFAFTRDRILSSAEGSMPIANEILDLFRGRFHPDGPTDSETFAANAASLRERIELEVDTETGRAILASMVDAVAATLRTNYFVQNRFGLAFRLDPRFLLGEQRPELPYGVFFVHGRGFNGFHVRFQDVARGGLRVVVPRGVLQHGREAERLYDEVYGLAFAQDLKNKDIPEGGAKCAILVEPGATVDRCVKSFVDSILDLITPDPATRARVIDYFGRDELIYLGPDENVTPAHIEWVVRRARLRGYPMPTAFMSSKPGAGINHKVYGVTSEGVNVFLEVALRARGIDPTTTPFTVKITGGPDGDVAGNMIKILDRDYGAHARIVGIADGSGVGEDPHGLDHEELLRLVREERPIAEFDKAKLGPEGRVVGLDDPEGVHLRNTLQNRIVADAFVPSGGRPATIHADNWREYLQSDGTPSSPLVVEGANLFLTPEARTQLSARGVTILKDSSANKCGVICSSYEIAASMALDEDEFLAIKEEFVQQVLDRLRELARLEAQLLMGEGQRHPMTPLPEISIRLSRVINNAAAAIEHALGAWSGEDRELADGMIADHLPPILIERAGSRLRERIPAAYLERLVASRLAANIVYREGIDFFASMEPGAIAETARRYLHKQRENEQIVRAVAASGLENAEHIAELLRRGGTRSALRDF